jgi:putative addiction module component (TIGR02574 family)
MTRFEKIENEAMELSRNDKIKLAYHLLNVASGNFATPEIERAWVKEAKRRIKALDNGEMETIPYEQVMAEIRAILKRSK